MKTLTKLYEAAKDNKIYHSFMDKFGNEYSYDNYADFSKFWFNLSRSYAKTTFPDFDKLQKAAANSAEARRPMNEDLNKSNGTVIDGVYRRNGQYAWVVKNGDGDWTVHIGYENGTNDAYGNETITGRKTYKSEKLAIAKAKSHTGIK